MDEHQVSVTAELDNTSSPLRLMLRPYSELIARWRADLVAKLPAEPPILPEDRGRAWMAGHAIDYRIRWWLAGVDVLPDSVLEGLRVARKETSKEIIGAFRSVAGTAAGALDANRERALCTVAVAAASIEPLFRVGNVPCAVQDLGYARFMDEYRGVIDDVLAMVAGLDSLIGDLAGRNVDAGPVVGVGRLGGDADLIVGDQLLEIKCTVDARGVATRALQQLLVYAARLRPDSIALVLPRQRTRVAFSLASQEQTLANLDREILAEYG